MLNWLGITRLGEALQYGSIGRGNGECQRLQKIEAGAGATRAASLSTIRGPTGSKPLQPLASGFTILNGSLTALKFRRHPWK